MRIGKPKSRDVGPGLRTGRPLPINQQKEREDLQPRPVPTRPSPGAGEHALLGSTHTDADEQDPVAGDMIYADTTPLWTRLAIGLEGYFLKVVSGAPAWDADAHNLLSARHGDTTATSPTRGDIITAQGASPAWARLAKGTLNYVLKAGANEPAWGQVAHSELTGIGANDHHNQQHALVGADHTASGLTTGHVLTATGATTFAFQAPGTSSNALLDGSAHTDTAAAAVSVGALVYGNNDPKWDALPAGSDGQVLSLAAGLPVWSDASTTSADAPQILGSWAREDISTLGGSGAPDELFNAWSKGANDLVSFAAGFPGSMRRLHIDLTADVGGAGDDVTAVVYKNGVATAFTVTLAGTAGTDEHVYATAAVGTYTFVATDVITIFAYKTGSPSARKMVCRLYVSN
jgi:hypothetical protein